MDTATQQTILQVIIVAFGITALCIAQSVMNKSNTPGFGPNNIRIFVVIFFTTLFALLITLGGQPATIAFGLFATVVGYGIGKLDSK